MEAKLIIIKGKANRAEVSLKLPSTIGRSREAELTIAHSMVSRQHCQLFEMDGLVKIRDLGSLNGTFVGSQQIKEADLPPHTEFSIGPLTFRVEYEYNGPVAAPSFAPAAQSPDAMELPDFQPANEEPEPVTFQPAAEDAPPAFAPPGAAVTDFDGGQSDASAWGEAIVKVPPVLPQPTIDADAAAEQLAAELLADEEEAEMEPPVEFAEAAEETTISPSDEPAEAQADEETVPLPSEPVETELAADGEDVEVSVETETETETETEAEEAEAEADAKEPPKKKRSWWPFGKGKKKAEEPSDEPSSTETAEAEQPTERADSTMAEQAPSVDAIVPIASEPAAFETETENENSAATDSPPPSAQPQPGDDALSQFLKGLK